MTSPLLQLDQVTKRFGQVVIAEKLSLGVGAGDTVGIVGPNGAGKTSLFGLISGDLAPGAGEISFDGRPLILRYVGVDHCQQFAFEHRMIDGVFHPNELSQSTAASRQTTHGERAADVSRVGRVVGGASGGRCVHAGGAG